MTDNPEIDELFNEAIELHDTGRYDEAERCYQSVLKLEPENANVLFCLGALYHETEQYAKSIKYSRKALELEPENPKIFFNIGLAYDMLGKIKKSLGYFNKALESDPEYATAYLARGNIRMDEGEFGIAAEDYQKAIALGVSYPSAHYNLARCLMKTGRFAEALDAYMKAEELPADAGQPDGEAVLGKGICLYMLGRDAEAEQSLQRVLKPEESRLCALAYLTAMDSLNGRLDSIKDRIARLEEGAPGFTTHETELLKCPHSRYIFLHEYPAGGVKDYSGPMWSDGYIPGYGPQAVPFLAECTACGKIHPVEDLVHVHRIPNRQYSRDLHRISWDDVQPAGIYIKALEQDWPEDMEKQFRIRLLWKQNDVYRENPEVEGFYDHEQHENLERLLDLVPHEKAPIRLAEFYRELGDFSKCLKILDKLPTDGARQFIVDGIKTAAEERDVKPVWLEKQKAAVRHHEEEIPFEKRHEYGFDPLPVTEDIFAFPEIGKDEEYRPVLSVKLSIVDPAWSGWGSFMYKDDEFYFHHDRLFSEEELKKFNSFSAGWREDLIWFWSFKSWNLPKDEDDLDEYYRILYQLFYKCTYADLLYTDYDSFLSADLEAEKDGFSGLWNGIEAELISMGGKYRDWVKTQKSRIYWDFFWQSYNGDFNVPDQKKLKELYELEYNHIRDLEENRRNAMSGLKYAEIGGSPSWFQGSNKTPGSAGFVGQLWSDYMNVGSKLLYLFYDEAAGMMIEKYDWD